MASPFQRGQALPEYLLLLAATLLIALVCVRAFHAGLTGLEDEAAYYFALPSP